VNTWSVVFLGVIAVATLATAVVQIGLLIAAGLLARRMSRFVDEVEREVRPVIGHLTSIAKDASHVSAIAVAQAERVEALIVDVAGKIDQTVTTIHSAFVSPARRGRAWLVAFQAVLAAIREFRSNPSRRRSRDEEDGLFI